MKFTYRILLLVLSCLSHQLSFAQTEEFYLKVLAKSSCTGEIYEPMWAFVKDTRDSVFVTGQMEPDNYPLLLPAPGVYEVFYGEESRGKIEIDSSGIHEFIFIKEHDIQQILVVDGPAIYNCCDDFCNGYHIDYWANGNPRIKGTFVNGKPVDSLFFYNAEGQLESVEVHRKFKKEYYQYTPDQQIKEHTKVKRKGSVLAPKVLKVRSKTYNNGRLTEAYRNLQGRRVESRYDSTGKLLLKRRKNFTRKYKIQGDSLRLLFKHRKSPKRFWEIIRLGDLKFWRRKYLNSRGDYFHKVRVFNAEGKKIAKLTFQTYSLSNFDFIDSSIYEASYFKTFRFREDGKWNWYHIYKSPDQIAPETKAVMKRYGFH